MHMHEHKGPERHLQQESLLRYANKSCMHQGTEDCPPVYLYLCSCQACAYAALQTF